MSFHKFSRHLSAFSLCSSGLISALLVLSTMYLFMKVFLSPDVILCAWLGSKYQLPNILTFQTGPSLGCPRGLTFTWGGCCGLCFWHKPTELAHSFFLNSVLESIPVFMPLSAVFYFINSPDNSPLFHSVLLVLFLLYWSFRLYISLWKSLSALL